MAIKSDANRRAVAKYKKENYDQIQLRVPKGEKDEIKAHAETQGESLNAFVIRAIAEARKRDNEKG
jgi:predicted HicB family RNase H-like nuclease